MTRLAANPASPSSVRTDRIEMTLGQLDSLPTLPEVALRLLRATTSSDSSAKDVVRIVESDPAMTAAVLRMLHAANMGVSRDVVSAERAVVLLGFVAVRNAILSRHVCQAFTRQEEDTSSAFDRHEFWRHSLAVACTAKLLAETQPARVQVEEAYVCGLLHDIGKIGLDACMPKSYGRAVEQARREHLCICDAERDVFGFDHTVAGRRLVKQWGLPQAVTDCVWMHHQDCGVLPLTEDRRALVSIVHAADNLVRREQIGFSGYRHLSRLSEDADALNLTIEQLKKIMERLPERMAPLVDFLGLGEEVKETMPAKALVEANQELGRVNDLLWKQKQENEIRESCLEAIALFARSLRPSGSVADVCAAAARAMRCMVDSEQALAFVISPHTSFVRMGYSEEGDGAAKTLILELPQPLKLSDDGGAASFALPGSFAVAPKACASLWRRCFSKMPDQRIWMLPTLRGQGLWSAVLCGAQDADIQRFDEARETCSSFATSVGLALGSAQAHAESERLNDELLGANRHLRDARERLVQSQSMTMIAEMAAGAAHELNNPLAVISGRAQLLLPTCQDEEQQSGLKVITEQAMRASKIVSELMEFAKPSPPQPTLLRFGDLLDVIYQHWLSHSYLTEERLSVSLADAEVGVFVDPSQLTEVLDALIANAIEAMEPESARLTINSPSLSSDETIRITVEDNGVGMSREVVERSTTPFHSSRPAGRGRGLGLPRAYRLTELNGGRLWIESEPNQGTKVTIEIPARAPTG